jgi:hypothetical protein
MAVLRSAFDVPLPLLWVAAELSTLCLTWVALSWSSGNPVRRRVLVAILWLVGMNLVLVNLSEAGIAATGGSAGPALGFLAAYGWMILFSAAAFWVTIAGVSRQRRGDDEFVLAGPPRRNAAARRRPGLRARIADRFRARCPVSSPARAQLWFEASSVGSRVLMIGALTALATPMFFTFLTAKNAMGEGLYFWVWFPLTIPVMVALPSMLGVRRRQGVSYLDAFAATRPLKTAHLVGLKVLVSSLAILLSWAILVAVLWVFAVRLNVWGPVTQADAIEYFGDFFPPPSGPVDAFWTMISFIVPFSLVVAGAGVLHAFWVLGAKRVMLTGVGLGLYIASWVFLGIQGWANADIVATTHLWIVVVAIVLGAAFLIHRLVVERVLTARALLAVLVIGLGLLLMSLWTNPNPDDIEDHMAAFIVGALPLIVIILSPWTFSRLRHR